MKQNNIYSILGQTDIYLIDQILKGRYNQDDVILDAGCGAGRNLTWFLHQGISIYGVDIDRLSIANLQKQNNSDIKNRFTVQSVEALSFEDHFFDHVVCSAVLHFAQSKAEYFAMINGLVRVLKKGGTLFIRTASDIGIEDKVSPAGDGVYFIPDGSTRFLLTRTLLNQLLKQFPITLIEELKTTNVADKRCMTTLVLAKTME